MIEVINGITYVAGQFVGASSSVPTATILAASLASGAKVGTQSGGNSATVWPAPQPGVEK